MWGMFSGASSFNADVSAWNVSNVTTMHDMFYRASSFNHDIGSWNVSKVIDMWGIISNAESFNAGISVWNLELLHVTFDEMLRNEFYEITKWNGKVKNNSSDETKFPWSYRD